MLKLSIALTKPSRHLFDFLVRYATKNNRHKTRSLYRKFRSFPQHIILASIF